LGDFGGRMIEEEDEEDCNFNLTEIDTNSELGSDEIE
jgi:hypothetical protein